jgi:hypothetical protein
MNAETLAKLFEFSYEVIRRNIAGIDAAESLAQPEPAGNCLNWVLGHIVAGRNGALRLLDQEPVWSEHESAPYVRGSAPIRDAAGALPWERIVEDFAASQERLRAGLAAATPESLATPPPDGTSAFGFSDVGGIVAGLHFHEAYHSGQTGLLRRLLDKEGAIP